MQEKTDIGTHSALQSFDAHTARILFRLSVVFVISNGLAGLAGQFFSVYDSDVRSRNMLIISLFLVAFLVVLLLIQTRIHAVPMQKHLYFGFALLSFVLAHLLNRDRGLLISTVLVGLVMPFLLILFRIRYAVLFGLVLLATVTIQWILQPTMAVDVGPGVYLYLGISAVTMTYLVVEGIRLFRRYEQGLHRHALEAETRNMELVALNQEYQASEETLQAQYDEILSLHLRTEDLNDKLQTILSHAHEGIVDYNTDSGQCLVSANALSLLGMDNADPLPQERGWITLPATRLPLLNGEWSTFPAAGQDTLRVALQVPGQTDDPRILHVVFCHYQARVDEAEHILAILQDVTQEERQLSQIHQLAYHDPLTGLLNRTGLEAAIHLRIEKGGPLQPFAVAVFDLRDFRSINETLGYAAGNAILKRIATGLSHLPAYFSDYARLGGDDFAMILSEPDRVEEFRDFIIQTRTNFGTDQTELYLGVSAGLSLYPEHGGSAEELVQNAEMAMMLSREKGPNELACYDLLIRDGVRNRVLLSNALENAMERNELSLVYQPVVSSVDRKLQGYEALVRWGSSRHGPVPPDVFIPIAEQKGSIHRIGQFVLEQACAFIQQLERTNRPGYVSVNVSGIQLLQERFAVQFLQTLAARGISTSRIGVEVTETAVIDNLERAVVQLKHLQENGIRIFLDDFGTGYSSLSYLGRLPVDVLKIDKQFVRDGMESGRGKGLLATMIDLARNLDISVVAEGVETQEQLETLRHMGCTMIQGYHVARPLTEKAALAWPEPL